MERFAYAVVEIDVVVVLPGVWLERVVFGQILLHPAKRLDSVVIIAEEVSVHHIRKALRFAPCEVCLELIVQVGGDVVVQLTSFGLERTLEIARCVCHSRNGLVNNDIRCRSVTSLRFECLQYP